MRKWLQRLSISLCKLDEKELLKYNKILFGNLQYSKSYKLGPISFVNHCYTKTSYSTYVKVHFFKKRLLILLKSLLLRKIFRYRNYTKTRKKRRDKWNSTTVQDILLNNSRCHDTYNPVTGHSFAMFRFRNACDSMPVHTFEKFRCIDTYIYAKN